MHLREPFTYRLIPVLRLALPVLAVVITIVACWNYAALRAGISEGTTTPWWLPDSIKSRIDGGYTFSRSEGGRLVFTIRAKSSLERADGQTMLDDVDVRVYGANVTQGDSHIRSRVCSVREPFDDIQCSGDVEFEFDGLAGHTAELKYNSHDRIVSSTRRVLLGQPGAMKAAANGMEYHVDSALLRLSGAVRIETASVLLLSSTTSIRRTIAIGDSRQAVQPNTPVAGEVRNAESPTWKIEADSMEIAISSDRAGGLQHVNARGDAQLNESGGDRRRLSATELNATFDGTGQVATVEARRNAQMALGHDRSLSSDLIRAAISGAIDTGGQSVLRVSRTTIEGSQFSIRPGDIIHFETAQHARLIDGSRQSSADRTEARFDSGTNSLRELIQSGSVEFQTPQQKGRAANVRFEPYGNVLTLSGSGSISDSQGSLEGDHIILNQRDGSVMASGNVHAVANGTPEPIVVVQAARGQGRPRAMVYTGNVRLSRGNVQIRAGRIQISGHDANERIYAEGSVQSSVDAVLATSAKLEYDVPTGRIRYSGSARVQQGSLAIESPEMGITVRGGRVAEIAAVRSAAVTWGSQSGEGRKAVYETATDSVLLTGNAQVRSGQRETMRGNQLTMRADGIHAAQTAREP